MLIEERVVRKVNSLVEEVVNEMVGGWLEEWSRDEVSITSKLFSQLEKELNGISVKELTLKVKYSGVKKKNFKRQDKKARVGVALRVNLPRFTVSKALLAQAHKEEVIQPAYLGELQKHCREMLKITPQSFVFLYSKEGVFIVPAVTVVGLESERKVPFLHQVYCKRLSLFIEEFLKCFVGDTFLAGRLGEKTDETQLIDKFSLQHLLSFELTSGVKPLKLF